MPDKYLKLTDDLYHYCTRYSGGTDDPLLAELRAETAELGDIALMQISPEQGSFLTLMTSLIQTSMALEIGTFTGYSSICIARGLTHGGRLICCDASEEYTATARKYWQRAGLDDRIQLVIGDARETLPQFLTGLLLDLVFIDADKPGYPEYYELVLPRVRRGGLIIFDNMLQGGRITEAETTDDPAELHEHLRVVHQLNRTLTADDRVENVLVPIADGLQLCRKR